MASSAGSSTRMEGRRALQSNRVELKQHARAKGERSLTQSGGGVAYGNVELAVEGRRHGPFLSHHREGGKANGKRHQHKCTSRGHLRVQYNENNATSTPLGYNQAQTGARPSFL